MESTCIDAKWSIFTMQVVDPVWDLHFGFGVEAAFWVRSVVGVFGDDIEVDAGGMNIGFASELLLLLLLLGEQREVGMVGGVSSAGGRELIVMVGGLGWCGGDDDDDGIGRCRYPRCCCCCCCCCCWGDDDGRGVS